MDSFDISRVGFDPLKHYSGVRMQQGRVITDDDYNENNRIASEQERRNNLHIIGSTGSPDNGFRILNIRNENGRFDFDISPGSIYVGGLRFEMDALKLKEKLKPGKNDLNSKRKRTFETYRTQRDWLQQPDETEYKPRLDSGVDRYDLVYIECWQQEVSAVEDSELLEVAFGGPDTGVRIRNMRRVKINVDIGEADCVRAWQKQIQNWKDNLMGTLNNENELIHDVHLKVSFLKNPVTDIHIAPSNSSGYRGLGNEAIRVQLTDKDHFTWGLNNASPLYKVAVNKDILTFISPLNDLEHWPHSRQVVEILPCAAILPNGEKIAEMTGFFTKINDSSNSNSGKFKMDMPFPSNFGTAWKKIMDYIEPDKQDPAEFFYLRVWNRDTDLSSPAIIPISTGTPVPLGNTGLAVTITGKDRICNDFWVIAARQNTPNRVVPWKLEVSASPNGVRRFYAPLAILHWHDNGVSIGGYILHDCRRNFRPLTELM
ncbi:MAG: DUF6519 domain-containing protein [Lentimicrobiaceae bacterium]|jgi:hypothetical protein